MAYGDGMIFKCEECSELIEANRLEDLICPTCGSVNFREVKNEPK